MIPNILSYIAALAIWWWGCPFAIAGGLSQRMTQYPHWHEPQLTQHQGELTYPEWFRGEWTVTSTLLEQIAPLAPEIVTPGFEGNRKYLDRPISFPVRFRSDDVDRQAKVSRLNLPRRSSSQSEPPIVADRAFNGMSIATAYLGKDLVRSVKVDPQNSTRQITQLAQDRQLVSVVTGFEAELIDRQQFLAAEVSQQIFRSDSNIYLNAVETTTSYQFSSIPTPKITATQISAIYLSPQDPDYFRALDPRNRPVALYKYRLDLIPVNSDRPIS